MLEFEVKHIDNPFDVRPWLDDYERILREIPEEAKTMFFVGRDLWPLLIKIATLRPYLTILAIVDSKKTKHKAEDTAKRMGLEKLNFREQSLDDFRKCNKESCAKYMDVLYDVVMYAPVPHRSSKCGGTYYGISRLLGTTEVVLKPNGTLIIYDRIYPSEHRFVPCASSIIEKIKASKLRIAFEVYIRELDEEAYVQTTGANKKDIKLSSVVQFLLAMSDVGFNPGNGWSGNCQAVPDGKYRGLLEVFEFRIVSSEMYILPMLKKRFREMFGITSLNELRMLLTTGLIVAKYK